MDSELERGLTPKTWNDTLKLLRATFKHLHPHLGDGSNPFHGLITKAAETINREPFSVEQMQRILAVCADDDFIRPVIVTGMCTAMRRGDCCLLRWAEVDGKAGFLSVKTAKTGETVDIPIFPLLQEELTKAKAACGDSPYCFPEAAAMYQSNPDGITWRVKQVLAKALTSNGPVVSGSKLEDRGELLRRGREYIESLGNLKRAVRMREVFERYMEGKTLDEVMVLTNSSRGAVSMSLNEIERGIGCALIRGKPRGSEVQSLQREREHGTRRASTHDFHSFRVTWITLALAAGVPLELVQRVTGHRTTAVVLKHYFRPGREDFRAVLAQAMPKMLGHGSTKSTKQQMKELLQRMTVRTWSADRKRLLELIEAL
jgi:integrase